MEKRWRISTEPRYRVSVRNASELKYSALKYRINCRGMTPEQAAWVEPGPTAARVIEVDGVIYPSIHKAAVAYAESNGIPIGKARYRLRRSLGQTVGGRHR